MLKLGVSLGVLLLSFSSFSGQPLTKEEKKALSELNALQNRLDSYKEKWRQEDRNWERQERELDDLQGRAREAIDYLDRQAAKADEDRIKNEEYFRAFQRAPKRDFKCRRIEPNGKAYDCEEVR